MTASILIIFKIFKYEYEISCHVLYEINTVLFIRNSEYNSVKIDDMLIRYMTDWLISIQSFENNLTWIMTAFIQHNIIWIAHSKISF